MPKRNVEKEKNCFGYYGFGAGIVLAENGPGNGGNTYCGESCPKAADCWIRHTEIVRAKVPGLMAEMDRLVKEGVMGQALVVHFMNKYGVPTPDITVMIGNMEDGAHAQSYGRVKNRGEATLPYPFFVN